MKLSQLLSLIEKIADDKGISAPYIVGGVPRDKVMGKLFELSDIDLTTGDEGIKYLAKELAIKLGANANYQVMPDGHARITIGTLKLDFSSNFRAPNIETILKGMGIKNPSEIQQELYSRDFTCNTLLMSLNLKEIQDPTGLAVGDIKKRILKTCLKPEITLGIDNRRVVRIIYLSAKLQFEVDPEIIAWVKDNPESIANVRPQYLIKKLTKALKYDKEKTVSLLDQMGLWPHIPPLKELLPYMTGNIKRI